jgi:ABC-type microcin C transport system permease subunit YejE
MNRRDFLKMAWLAPLALIAPKQSEGEVTGELTNQFPLLINVNDKFYLPILKEIPDPKTYTARFLFVSRDEDLRFTSGTIFGNQRRSG